MKNNKIERKILDLMEKDYPRAPRKIELGAWFLYRCYWYSCDREVNQWMDFCPGCGQRLDWSKYE